jgi:hypothetical protein
MLATVTRPELARWPQAAFCDGVLGSPAGVVAAAPDGVE